MRAGLFMEAHTGTRLGTQALWRTPPSGMNYGTFSSCTLKHWHTVIRWRNSRFPSRFSSFRSHVIEGVA